MKVSFEKETKKYITLDEAPIVREIIKDMKEDEFTPAEYGKSAIQALYSGNAYNITVLESSAKIAKNQRAWNAYSNESGMLDIWIETKSIVKAMNSTESDTEFVIVGSYLSDIWQITSDNMTEISSHFYVRRFKEVR